MFHAMDFNSPHTDDGMDNIFENYVRVRSAKIIIFMQKTRKSSFRTSILRDFPM